MKGCWEVSLDTQHFKFAQSSGDGKHWCSWVILPSSLACCGVIIWFLLRTPLISSCLHGVVRVEIPLGHFVLVNEVFNFAWWCRSYNLLPFALQSPSLMFFCICWWSFPLEDIFLTLKFPPYDTCFDPPPIWSLWFLSSSPENKQMSIKRTWYIPSI